MENVCADCGHEQASLFGGCEECQSPRVVMISVVEELFGPDWHNSFPRNKFPKAWEQPGWNA